jgi:glutathione S-transferase
VNARLYGFGISNSTQTAKLLLRFKGIDATFVELRPLMYPLVLRLLGFQRGTVPALKLDDRRIDGSLEIAQALEAIVPEPPLYPADPERRRAVEEAERWGEAELQMVTRRVARWALAHSNASRVRVMREFEVPLPLLMATLHGPIARRAARRAGADEASVRQDLTDLRATLDRVDVLIANGVIGDPDAPNAADFQIAPSVRGLGCLSDLTPLVEGRPCDALARRLLPDAWQLPAQLLPPHQLAAAGL